MDSQVYDLAIIGGGPSGLSAAINGASEGLSVLLVDAEATLGGQARESAAIENYPGFPDGITGDHLMTALTRQAEKFGAGLLLPTRVGQLFADDTVFRFADEFGDERTARTILLTLGLSYRRLEAENLSGFLGNGAYYGIPFGRVPSHKCEVAVVGGANSAGQAVLHLAHSGQVRVRLLCRSALSKSMSEYLIERIRLTPNIEVIENCTVKACGGKAGRLNEIEVEWEGASHSLPADYLFMFIGAVPRTFWLSGAVDLAKPGFIPTWTDCGAELPFETSMKGVFAAGDVRQGSTKRIAAAVGEGAAALQMIHRRLG